MIDISQLFVSTAFAQQAVPGAGSPTVSAASPLMGYVPFILIFCVFYFLVIRPQQQKFDEHGKLVKSLQRGDRVVTSSGIHGKIAKLEGEEHIMVEIAEGIVVKMLRSSVTALEAKTQPVGEVEKK
jgi:preprotein translocase subunit YajC